MIASAATVRLVPPVLAAVAARVARGALATRNPFVRRALAKALMETLARGHHVAALALPLAAVLLGGCDAGRALPASGAAPLELASAERGRLAITRYPCGSCHLIPGVPGASGRVGPTLEHFGRRSYIAGEIPNDASALQRWLQDPPAMVPGTAMPDMAVPEDVAADMAAYLMSLR